MTRIRADYKDVVKLHICVDPRHPPFAFKLIAGGVVQFTAGP
jgi:hypothetical protein